MEKRKIIDLTPADRLQGTLRRTLLIGCTVVGVFFVGFGGWAAWAPLTGAAVAPGFISPEGKRRQVQHLEGGIVERLLVRNGSTVTAGQPLVELDASLARAKYHSVLKEYRSVLSRHARLMAERLEEGEVAFPVDDWGDRDVEVGRRLFAAEQELFQSRRLARETKRRILRQRIVQLQDEITGIEAQIESQTRNLALIREEAKGIEGLVDKGFERRPRLIGLQREETEILGARAGNKAALARAQSKIGETEIEITSLDSSHREEVETSLSEVQAKLGRLREERRALRDILDRTVITAPVSGIVMKLRIHTEGGVLSAGDTVLDIVPSGEQLLIEARISPKDIDEVHPGLPAKVVLTGYSQRNTPQLHGSVREVSADRMVDEKTGEFYYQARIELPADHVAEVAPQVNLKPGMPADVMVVTGKRTLLDYLIDPVTSSFRSSFNES